MGTRGARSRMIMKDLEQKEISIQLYKGPDGEGVYYGANYVFVSLEWVYAYMLRVIRRQTSNMTKAYDTRLHGWCAGDSIITICWTKTSEKEECGQHILVGKYAVDDVKSLLCEILRVVDEA